MPSFYNGKRFFLTYPQCASTPHELVAFLQQRASVVYYVVARELHANGDPHLHACVEFAQTERHGVDWLDFEGKHPNKQDPRNWDACKTYTKKDKDYLESETPQGNSNDGDLREICVNTEHEVDWMLHCATKKIPFPYARWLWEYFHCDQHTILASEHIGVMCGALQAFQFIPHLHQTFILEGPSGCGKTTWAKINMPKPALFVSHIDQLKQFTSRHKSIIFDDVDFNHYPRTSQIAICDFDNVRAIHCRHAVATIPAGIFKVFTCNTLPLSTDDPAIKRRVKIYHIKK